MFILHYHPLTRLLPTICHLSLVYKC